MILAAVYLLWAGALRPGGAFQAGAILAAAAVLLNLAGVLPAWAVPRFWLRLGMAGGLLIFLAVAAGLLAQGALLRYPPEWAGTLILLIETGLTLSLGPDPRGLVPLALGNGGNAMTPGLIYALVGLVLFVLGSGGVILLTHPVRRILAFNLMGSGVFLVLVGLAQRDGHADPVPQAMVLTGIVVSVAATALALALGADGWPAGDGNA